jgi:hypothetical protein
MKKALLCVLFLSPESCAFVLRRLMVNAQSATSLFFLVLQLILLSGISEVESTGTLSVSLFPPSACLSLVHLSECHDLIMFFVFCYVLCVGEEDNHQSCHKGAQTHTRSRT